MRRTLLVLGLSIFIAAPAFAQQPLKLSFQDGRVSVDATAVPISVILKAWGDVGGTKIVGAERIAGGPLTLKLVNVAEAQALEIILRGVSGYMAAPRNAATTTGPSTYDRILVMASAPGPDPAAARPSSAQPSPVAGAQRFVPPPRQPRPEMPEQPEADEPDQNPPQPPPVFTFPQPGQQNGQPPGTNGPAGVVQPGMTVPGNTITINPAQPAPGQPTAPIGVAQPGMMVPAPQPQPTPPGMIRPPGGK